MRKLIALILIASISILYLVSCDGGDGNGEGEFKVFDVQLSIDSIAGCARNDVPVNELKLSLLIRGTNISGTGELLAYGNIGDAEEVKGRTENDNLYLKPFEVRVASDPPTEGSIEFGPSEIWFSFNEFVGEFTDENMDGFIDGIEGTFNSLLTIIKGGDLILYCGEVTGEISGKARVPEGCVSRKEAPALECPAEGFVNQCDEYANYACGGCEPINGEIICTDFFFHVSMCEVIDCLNVSCQGLPINLDGIEDFGSFDVITGTSVFPCSG